MYIYGYNVQCVYQCIVLCSAADASSFSIAQPPNPRIYVYSLYKIYEHETEHLMLICVCIYEDDDGGDDDGDDDEDKDDDVYYGW